MTSKPDIFEKSAKAIPDRTRTELHRLSGTLAQGNFRVVGRALVHSVLLLVVLLWLLYQSEVWLVGGAGCRASESILRCYSAFDWGIRMALGSLMLVGLGYCSTASVKSGRLQHCGLVNGFFVAELALFLLVFGAPLFAIGVGVIASSCSLFFAYRAALCNSKKVR